MHYINLAIDIAIIAVCVLLIIALRKIGKEDHDGDGV